MYETFALGKMRHCFFYNKENKKVDVYYKNNGLLEIPKSKGIKRIEIYLHTTKHKDNYLEFKIPENTGQIFIDNLSRYLITDFDRYSFIWMKNKVLMNYPWGEYKLENKNQKL